MKPAYSKECKIYGLRSTKKPAIGFGVSGVAVVVDAEGKGFSYIGFSPAFERAVGLAMPVGVGPESPIFIKVMEIVEAKEWRVYAHYIDEPVGRLLWVSKEKPAWVTRVRRAGHA